MNAPSTVLNGLVDPLVLQAPKTAGDPVSSHLYPCVDDSTLHYLKRQVVGKPWSDALVLMATVCAAQRLNPITVHHYVRSIQATLKKLFAAYGLEKFENWNPQQHMMGYLRGEVLPETSETTRYQDVTHYRVGSRHLERWLRGLPAGQQAEYQPFMFPLIETLDILAVFNMAKVFHQSRQERKTTTEAVVNQYARTRLEAHLRFNRICRLRKAYQQALSHLKEHPDTPLPFRFSYEEGGDAERNIPAMERLHYQIWDRPSFLLAHQDLLADETIRRAKKRIRGCDDAKNFLFLEYVRSERLSGDAPAQGWWFEDIMRLGLLGAYGRQLPAFDFEVEERRAWLKAWGYSEDTATGSNGIFLSQHQGILQWTFNQAKFFNTMRRITKTILIPVEPLYAATFFGLMALDIFTTTGMRMGELLQIRLGKDCLVRLTQAPPPEAKDRTPRVRYVLRLVPKGHLQPADFFVGAETVRFMNRLVRYLQEHYGLQVNQPIKGVKYNPAAGRTGFPSPAPYLFQYSGRHFSQTTVNSCLRFLLHGLVFRTREGEVVIVSAHLFRHAFATHAVHVEKIPVDIVGAWLKQKNLDVTEYYSQPTQTMIAESSDQLLARLAAHINVDLAVVRSPGELQELYEDARGKAGTLAEVIGGHCISHGYCAAKFACTGCPGKVPDPEKRKQLEVQQKWAQEQVQFAIQEGMLPWAERMKQVIRDGEVEMLEMDQMERYRQDEQTQVCIREEKPDLAGGESLPAETRTDPLVHQKRRRQSGEGR